MNLAKLQKMSETQIQNIEDFNLKKGAKIFNVFCVFKIDKFTLNSKLWIPHQLHKYSFFLSHKILLIFIKK
jgi:hypothetical protein